MDYPRLKSQRRVRQEGRAWGPLQYPSLLLPLALVLVTGAFAFVGVVASPALAAVTTATSASAFTYDAPTSAGVGVDLGSNYAASTPPSEALQEPVQPSVDLLGTPTTRSLRSVATEDGDEADDECDPCPAPEYTIGPHGSLPSNRKCQRHHIIQHQAVSGVTRYSYSAAPAIILRNSAHYRASAAQNGSAMCGGTYADERAVALEAMAQAGVPPAKQVEAIEAADQYFKGQLGLNDSSKLSVPGSRLPCR